MKAIRVIALGAALASAQGQAQTTPPRGVASSAPPRPLFATPLPPADPVRLAAARPVIDAIWPMGTYARLMHVMMDQMVTGMVARMFDMRPSDLVAMLGVPAGTMPKGAAGQPEETLGQSAEKKDPAIRERIRLTMNAVTEETAKLMTEVEPGVRDALAASYARRFTVGELADLQRFFATPTGRAYGADHVVLMIGPDMVNAMQPLIPKMVQSMPAIMAHIADATKNLPPAHPPAPPPAK